MRSKLQIHFGFFQESIGPFLLCLIFMLANWNESTGQEPVEFAHDILPVLKSKCAKCHANGTFKGGLTLESREGLVEAGVVQIGSREESELFLRITSTDPEEQMPPEGKRLTKAQIETIGAWIDEGLEWPDELTLKDRSFARSLQLKNVPLVVGSESARHPIDWILQDYFQKNSIEHPDSLSDNQFVRRVKMDLLGQLPTHEEIDRFVNNVDSNKRQELIDEFLDRDRAYADHWISFWNDLLRNDYAGTGYIDGGRSQVTQWLHRSLMENKPYDDFVKELINPSAESAGFANGIKWRGTVNASQVQPLQFSQNIAQIFLGINMKCASCHDSFIDDWKLEDAYGLAAFIAEEPLQMHRCDVPTGKTAKSKFVFPSVGEIDGALPRTKRLARLSELMTSKENGRFPRTIVNRLWDRMADRGLVVPVDVMSNEAWSESLLDFLAMDLINHGYDLKHTLRLIATARIYQSDSVVPQFESVQQPFIFRGVHAKRMTAEQFVDAVWKLTDAAPSKMDAKLDVVDEGNENFPVRSSLVQSNSLMRSLGRPNREQVVTTRPGELSTLQALDLTNGAVLAVWLQQGAEKWIHARKENGWTHEQMLSRLFREALAREPTEAELELLQLDHQNELQTTVEDALWIVMMLPEFQFIR